MKKSIEVKCIESFDILTKDFSEKLAEVIQDCIYVATLNEESDEYFAKDNEGREFLVGELDMGAKLILDEAFELIE